MLRMTLFVTIVVTIYTAMHLAVFVGMRPLLAGRPVLRDALIAWMVLMILAPFSVRLLERAGLESGARLGALVGYCWLGFVFLAFCGFIAVFVWDLGSWLVHRLQPAVPLHLHGTAATAAVLGLSLVACLYGLGEAYRLRIERLTLPMTKLSAGAGKIRVVQISDLHLGLIHRRAFLRRVVSRIEALRPDLLVATGDIVDAQINHLDGLAELLAGVHAPLGKFAVTGNHEYYAGIEQARDFIRRADFVLLEGQSVELPNGLRIAGVSDPAGGDTADEGALLSGAPARLTLLLKHRPRIATAALDRFDLQLSGHAHRGQIFPFNLVTHLEYPLQDGFYRLPEGAALYTSRGTGTWGPPMRIFAPPEITLIRLVPTH
ncbi:MAG TPA: metallophosphoesterase [Desulfuromonadales bacterium]|nr:metallophosphoesterase [Desulfuromonadales bacterium]